MSQFHDIAHLRAEIGRLNEIIRERDATIEELRSVLAPDIRLPKALGLTPSQQRITIALFTRSPAAMSPNTLNDLLHENSDSLPRVKIIDVHVARMRPKLKRFDIFIETIWGTGYRLPTESAVRLRALIDQENAAPPFRPVSSFETVGALL